LKEIEARGVDLKKIERTIGKIRIDGDCTGELRRDLVESVAARTEAPGFVLRLLPIEAVAQRSIDLNVEADTLIDVRDTRERAGARNVGRQHSAVDRAPAIFLILVADLAGKLDHPIRFCRIERKILERDRHLRSPAVLHDARAPGPDRVPL